MENNEQHTPTNLRSKIKKAASIFFEGSISVIEFVIIFLGHFTKFFVIVIGGGALLFTSLLIFFIVNSNEVTTATPILAIHYTAAVMVPFFLHIPSYLQKKESHYWKFIMYYLVLYSVLFIIIFPFFGKPMIEWVQIKGTIFGIIVNLGLVYTAISLNNNRQSNWK